LVISEVVWVLVGGWWMVDGEVESLLVVVGCWFLVFGFWFLVAPQ